MLGHPYRKLQSSQNATSPSRLESAVIFSKGAPSTSQVFFIFLTLFTVYLDLSHLILV